MKRLNVSNALLYAFVVIFALICFIPFWMVFINSFADEGILQTTGYQLWPATFSLDGYSFVLSGGQIWSSYGISLFVTSVGTALAVWITSSFAYLISHPRVKYRNLFSFLSYFTIIFGPGLVGFYILIANWLGLKDNTFALILPYVYNPFYALILVGFFRTVPNELYEAALIDGANDIHVFIKIILPLSKAVIATVALMFALQYWNDWWLALLFIDNHRLHPLQIMIRQLISNMNAQAYIQGSTTNYGIASPTMSVQLVIVCLTIGPIILIYPWIQKYFIKGVIIGGVKG